MSRATKSMIARLKAYRNLRRELTLQAIRLNNARRSLGGLKSPATDAPSHGHHGDTVSIQVAEVMQLELKVNELRDACTTEHDAIERIIARVHNAEQRCVLRMRYFDVMAWPDIAYAFYGEQSDYPIAGDKYLHLIYNIHNRAIHSMVRAKSAA